MPIMVGKSITGVIIAGGLSRRMGGGDKALRMLAGRPLLAHVVARLGPQVGRLVLNANGDPARFAAFGMPVVADATEDRPGPLAGLLAGMRWAGSEGCPTRWLASSPADTPFLPVDLVERLCAAAESEGRPIALAASSGGLQQLCGLWSIDLMDDLARALAEGTRRVLEWAERHRPVRVDFPDTLAGGTACDPFLNVNRPEDLALAEALLAQRGGD